MASKRKREKETNIYRKLYVLDTAKKNFHKAEFKQDKLDI